MKNVIRLLVLSLVLQSFQCDEDIKRSTPEILAEKKQEILNYIQSFSCSNASDCSYIAFGAKPCGGPREYLAFPNAINLQTLQNMVADYYALDNQYNIQTGPDGTYWVTLQPLMSDIQESVSKLEEINIDELTNSDKELLNLKILGLHTVYQFLGSLVTEQSLKEKRVELGGSDETVH